MGDAPQSDIESRLSAIQGDVREMRTKLDRLLVGENGTDGLFTRVVRVEDRQDALAWFCRWIGAAVAGLAAVIVPGWFKQH